jgi:hypothetical protein
MDMDLSFLKEMIHDDLYSHSIQWREEYENHDDDVSYYTEDDQIWWRMRDFAEEEVYNVDYYDENTLLSKLEDMPMRKYVVIQEYWQDNLSPNKNTFSANDKRNSHHLFTYMMAIPHSIVLDVVIDLMPDICVIIADEIICERQIIRKKTFCEVSKLPDVLNELICGYV